LERIFWRFRWRSKNYTNWNTRTKLVSKKNNISKIIDRAKISAEDDFTKKKLLSNGDLATKDGYEKEKGQSIKATALIRAYRIRGHLMANLDPLRMMERKYLNELDPSNHGFKKEDYNKKIYLREYMDRKYSTINEILVIS